MSRRTETEKKLKSFGENLASAKLSGEKREKKEGNKTVSVKVKSEKRKVLYRLSKTERPEHVAVRDWAKEQKK